MNPNDELKAFAEAADKLHREVAGIEHAVGCAVRHASQQRSQHAHSLRTLAALAVPAELEPHKARALERMQKRGRLLEDGTTLQARIDLATDRLEDARKLIKRGGSAEDVLQQLWDTLLVLRGQKVNEPGI